MQLYKDVTIRRGSWDFKKMSDKGFQEKMQTFSLYESITKWILMVGLCKCYFTDRWEDGWWGVSRQLGNQLTNVPGQTRHKFDTYKVLEK